MSPKPSENGENETFKIKFSQLTLQSLEGASGGSHQCLRIHGAKHSLSEKILGGPSAEILDPVTWVAKFDLLIENLEV